VIIAGTRPDVAVNDPELQHCYCFDGSHIFFLPQVKKTLRRQNEYRCYLSHLHVSGESAIALMAAIFFFSFKKPSEDKNEYRCYLSHLHVSGESAAGLAVQQTVVRTAVPRHVLPAKVPTASHGSHQLRDVQAEDVAPDPLLPLRRRNGPVRGDDDLQLHGVLPENAPVVP
tara:strand:+ start:131 stop:643 length:513 start_codon:yes stop_codon:yes gene_type:complete